VNKTEYSVNLTNYSFTSSTRNHYTDTFGGGRGGGVIDITGPIPVAAQSKATAALEPETT
jgi:hypothetical protein